MEASETTCATLLLELQRIWDEVGESEVERDKMLYEIEQDCLEVYKGKIYAADECKRALKKAIDVAESEIQSICAALRDQSVKFEKKPGLCLKEELQSVRPLMEEMREKKAERKRQFVAVLDELQKVSEKIYGCTEDNLYKIIVEGTDLSVERLEKLQRQLIELHEEKSKRLKHVLNEIDNLNSLCGVLGVDFKHTLHTIHPTLNDSNEAKDITDLTIKRLITAVESLREVKIQRMQRLQDLAATLVELWDLMDTPMEEQQDFQNVTIKIAASEPEITEPNILSTDFIKNVENEVSRLEQLKSSKVKEIILKKTFELEEICRSTHMVSETAKKYSIEALTGGVVVDPVHLLEEIDLDIEKAKGEALSRKEILDKVDKWLAMCQEESWLEEYNRDENRYNAGRGAHLALKRAEKARVAVNKIPAMVEVLGSKITAWERERGVQFLYDGEPLSSRLEEYNSLKLQREQEKLKRRDQKRLQVQLIAEKEALFGSRPSPSMSAKKSSRSPFAVASNRKLSLGGSMLHNLKAEKASPYVRANKKENSMNQNTSGYQHYGGVASQTPGRRISEIPGHVVNKQTSTAAKTHLKESHSIRKPLSPLCSTLSSKINIANFMEDQNRMQSGTFESVHPCVETTPTKSIYKGDEENRTPKTLPNPVPKTPLTISAPMLMATTPYVTCDAKIVKKIMDETEYSFEELRAGFICPTLQS